ncbi:spartin isoform X2 [Dermochelys coriacea]|uniref:spartin isoform X2 n=1 Tax=Dermochelys coriacea TaxID=27794 RepID=UPI0018E80935|nr:spartin isoform X2 [Dermochelys coriacea]
MEQEQDPAILEDENIKAIKEEFKKAFMFVNKGLNTDELGQKEEARNYYKQGLDHLLRGVNIPSQGPEYTGSQWDSARQMQQKMQETLQNVRTRLNILEQNTLALQTNATTMNVPLEVPKLYPVIPTNEKPARPPAPNSLIPPSGSPAANENVAMTSKGQLPAMSPSSPKALSLPHEAPPVYTPHATDGHYSVSYGTDSGEFSSVGEDYYTKCTQPPPLESLGVDADELILILQGVQIFFVTPDGQVSAPSYPGYLRIVKFLDTDGAMAQNRPPAFLQVCDWLYPLMCNQSPVLCCNTGVYMFPDLMSQVPGSHVGVVLSSELPAADRELFEDLLKQMSNLRVQPLEASGDVINLAQTVCIQPEPDGGERKRELPEWSEKVAHGILSGASWLSWGLVKGAEYTGKAIHKGASKLREHIQPEEKPLEVSPTVAKGLHVAKQATGGAVKVSRFLVEGVCSIASSIGKELAPHVKKHGSKLVPESLKKDKDGKSTFDGAMVVAASGVQGFSTVWQGLESAAKCIANSVSTETVHTVQHKYKNRKHGDQLSTATKSDKQ